MPSLAREKALHARVNALAKTDNNSPAFCKKWKKAIANGLVDNITNILNDCCMGDSYFDLLSPKELSRRIANDELWDTFVVRVVAHMKRKGSWTEADDEFHTFWDTANGCDEVVEAAGADVLQDKD